MVIDTDVLIDHFHNNHLATAFIQQTVLEGKTIFISVVTVTEILAGLRSGEENATEALLSLFTIRNVDENIARMAGYYLNQYRKSHKIDLGDALIAATAKTTGSALYTRNSRHYPMLDIDVRIPYQRGN